MAAQDQQSRALAPCPFCGSADVTLEHVGGNSFEAFCEHCGASGPSDSEQWRATKGWNARALPAGMEPAAEILSSRPGNDTSTIDKAYPDGTKLYTAAQVQAMQSELEQIGAVAACFGADWPDVEGEPEVLRRVKWAARQLKASQERAPLTDERIQEIDDETHFHESPDWPRRFARAIEAEARKKTTP